MYSLVASVISYLTVLDLGLGNAIVRYTAKFRAEGKTTEQYEMFGMFLVLYVIIGVVAFIAGLGLYFNVDTLFGATMTVEELDKARIMMLFLIFNLAVTFPMSIFGSIITAYERFVFPKVVNIVRVMQHAPEKQNGEDGLPIPPYKVYNIGNNSPENLLDFVQILQEELTAAGVLPADYDFEAHKEFVPMQPGDVPVTYADTSALEEDFGFKPHTSLREGLRRFAIWYKEFYG